MAEDRSTLDLLRGSRIVAYSIGALSLACGIFLLAWTDRSETIIGRIIGVILLLVGLGEVFEAVGTHRKGSYWGLLLLRGAMNVVVGGVLLFWPSPALTFLTWVLGLDLVLTGLIGLIASRQVPPELGRSGIVARGVVGIVFGLIVMFWPNETLTVFVWLIGLQLILLGLLLLVSGYQLSKAAREAV